MYNLNVSSNTPTPPQQPHNTPVNNLLAVENGTNTPRTPEILNTLIAMTNPMDNYNSNFDKNRSTYNPATANNDSSNSSGLSQDSPTSPPSVQKTCTQLIKAGLKLSIQSKRKFSSTSGGDTPVNKSGSDSGGHFLDLDVSTCASKRRKLATNIKGEITTGSEDEYDTSSMISPPLGLTPEDEERRRRRRERNKIAATKCRLKKREKTVNLVQESETLETQNIKLKTEIQQLQTQRQRLSDMLSMHSTTCVKHSSHTYETENNNYTTMGYSEHHECNTTTTTTTLPSIVTTLSSPYHRPQSVDPSLSYQLDYPGNDPFADTKPVIIVTDNGDTYATQSGGHFTDLDSPNSPFQYSNNTSHCYDQPVQSSQGYTNSGLDNGCMA